MPQFILNDHPHAKLYDTLDEFTKGYIEAMYFTNGDTGDDNESLLNDLGVERLTKEAMRDIAKDCNAFTGHIMPDGCFMRQWLDRIEDYDDAQAGRDFWYTRQGHGAGFWDRDQIDRDTGEALTKAAHSFGEAYVEVSRGWIYHR